MINKDLCKLAIEFFEKYSSVQSRHHLADLKQLQLIKTREQLNRSDLKDTFSSNKYNVKLSEESFRMLKDFVKMKNSKPLVDIIKENIMLESNNLTFDSCLNKIIKYIFLKFTLDHWGTFTLVAF